MRVILTPELVSALAERPVTRDTMRLLALLIKLAEESPDGCVRRRRPELAADMGVKPGVVTLHLSRLVNAGIVERLTKMPAETLAVRFRHGVVTE